MNSSLQSGADQQNPATIGKPPDKTNTFNMKPILKIQGGNRKGSLQQTSPMENVIQTFVSPVLDEQNTEMHDASCSDAENEDLPGGPRGYHKPVDCLGRLQYNHREPGQTRGSSNGCANFRSWISDNNMEDLGFIGSRFTWKRALCNEHYQCQIEKTTVRHLSRFASDHNPLLITTTMSSTMHNKKPNFRYLVAWEAHDLWLEWLQRNWKSELPLQEAQSALIVASEEWKFQVFGNIIARKKRLIASLDGVQKSL
ncbi:OLC1v1032007C1 [Oldenlandia corymbosa var. corymbosa]|uniref:OLC1v1032007C1 n=1 Tax=Oldenlandia corymbosa var. corymbosa TaxID=529605 RepID=A0AAV1CKS9_OLDCO|nr:OLC1v1032007C1 [Oldenlandia corymbosa var. corymbosa]